jgi:hypothetical protein
MNSDESNLSVVEIAKNAGYDSTLHGLPKIKPEAEIVADLKNRSNIAFAQLCLVMDDAVRAGFRVQWTGVAVNPFMRHEAVDLHLIKRY